MQAILPDLNTAYITYRRQVIISLGSQKYNFCFGSLNAINGLLPENYQVTISDSLYNEKIKQTVFAICGFCSEEHNFQTIRVRELLSPMIASLVSGIEYDKVWECPKCSKINRLVKTKFAKNILKEPYFLGVVPKPPTRRDGLLDRSAYNRNVQKWIWTFLDELEHKMGLYRQEYTPKENQIEGEYIDTDSEGMD